MGIDCYLIRYALFCRFDGIPVLFLPGNSGSHMQVRSIASVALRKALSQEYNYHFDYFTSKSITLSTLVSLSLVVFFIAEVSILVLSYNVRAIFIIYISSYLSYLYTYAYYAIQ